MRFNRRIAERDSRGDIIQFVYLEWLLLVILRPLYEGAPGVLHPAVTISTNQRPSLAQVTNKRPHLLHYYSTLLHSKYCSCYKPNTYPEPSLAEG